jgi:hypothetical protein
MMPPEMIPSAIATKNDSSQLKKRKRSPRRAVIGLLAAFTAMGLTVLAYQKVQEARDRTT